jgi:hypothetical protein
MLATNPPAKKIVMNRIRVHARRLASVLAALAGTVLALSAGAPAAFAAPRVLPDPGGGPASPAGAGAHTLLAPQPGVGFRFGGPLRLAPQRPHPTVAHLHAAVTGGMPGWQIALIAIGAALAAATLAVLVDRALTARGRVRPTAA